ncbi:MAG: hypothetical protein V7765_06490 [Oleispira sp.]
MKKQMPASLVNLKVLANLIALASLFAGAIALININPFTEQDLVFREAGVQPSSSLQASNTQVLSTQVLNTQTSYTLDSSRQANSVHTNKGHDFTTREVEEIFPAITLLMNSDLPDDLNESSRAAFIEKFKQDVDPKIYEIYQSLQAMEKIDFPEKERYKKIATQRIQQLEHLKGLY